jgi:hypothetical protein
MTITDHLTPCHAAGDYGFDPLRLGGNPTLLPYYQEAELMNGRWVRLAHNELLANRPASPSRDTEAAQGMLYHPHIATDCSRWISAV